LGRTNGTWNTHYCRTETGWHLSWIGFGRKKKHWNTERTWRVRRARPEGNLLGEQIAGNTKCRPTEEQAGLERTSSLTKHLAQKGPCRLNGLDQCVDAWRNPPCVRANRIKYQTQQSTQNLERARGTGRNRTGNRNCRIRSD